MRVEDLRLKKGDLNRQKLENNANIKTRIKANIIHLKQAILLFETLPDLKFNIRDVLFNHLKTRINSLINTNSLLFHTITGKILFDEEFTTKEVPIIDTAITIYSLKELLLCINKNEMKEDINFIGKEINAKINIKSQCIIFEKQGANLMSIKPVYIEWEIDQRIINLFEQDFNIKIDLKDMQWTVFKKSIDLQIEMLLNSELNIEKYEMLNSQALVKRRGEHKIIDKNIILNEIFEKYAKEAIKSFEMALFKKYVENEKIFGLILSYFFCLNPGLIEYFDIKKYRKKDSFYFIAWMDTVK